MSATPSSSDPRTIEVLPARVTLAEASGDTRAGDGPPRSTVYTGEVGDFRPGNPASRWALARYLVARTLGDNAIRAVLGLALVFAALTVVLAFVSAPVVLTVLVGLITLGWFVAWRVARALWSRLTGGPALLPVRAELDRLVGETRPRCPARTAPPRPARPSAGGVRVRRTLRRPPPRRDHRDAAGVRRRPRRPRRPGRPGLPAAGARLAGAPSILRA